MKRLPFTFIAFALSLVLLSSCSKNDPAPSKTQLLTQGTWVLGTFTSTNILEHTAGQILVGTEWKFNTDKTFRIYTSGVPSDGGTWFLSSDELKLHVTNVSGSAALEITILTSDKLEFNESDGSPVVNNYKFARKK